MIQNHNDNRFDFLRLLAAWLVLFSHCYPLGGRPHSEPLSSTLGIDTLGGVGVAIFFVVSGYLVTLSIERSYSLPDFIRRRALRIFPALISICLLCVLFLGPSLTTLPLAAYWRHGMTWDYLMTASAWTVRYPLPGVFANNPLPYGVNGSLWSLPYELRCYLVLALLSLLPSSWRLKTAMVTVGLSLLLLLLVRPTMGAFDQFLGLDHYHTKLGLLFSLGAGFAAWRDHFRPPGWPALLMLACAVLLPHSAGQLFLYVVGLGTLTLCLALKAPWLPRIPPRMGDWSYGVYLYGFPVQQVLAHFKLNEVSFAGYVGVCSVVTFALAGLSWHLVEKQALRWK